MSHVLWLCYKACQYYSHELPPRQMRTLLIAALFHDFDHTGRPHRGDQDPDGINIEIAISGLRRYLASYDRALMPEIEALIEATHFPYKVDSQKLDLLPAGGPGSRLSTRRRLLSSRRHRRRPPWPAMSPCS